MPTILLADDHPITVMGTKTFVENLGYVVVDTCSNGIAAFNSIVARCPDLALVDMNMPGLNGIELLEKLGRQKCVTRVVLLTMHNEPAIFTRAKALGAWGYVLKEFALSSWPIAWQPFVGARFGTARDFLRCLPAQGKTEQAFRPSPSARKRL